jgi:glycosyl transferase family 25
MVDFISKILYINLEHRTDRKLQIEGELRWTNIPEEKIIRIDAIKNENGAIGCTMSHIKCIKLAKELNLENVLILEDDFSFRKDNFINRINQLKNFIEINDWDIFLFSGNKEFVTNIKDYNDIYKVVRSQTTSGYLVNKNYYDKLLNNFETGLNLYQTIDLTNPQSKYSIDIFWKKLQKNDRWYITKPTIGFQRKSFSDITKK